MRVIHAFTALFIALFAVGCERADPEPAERPLLIGDLPRCQSGLAAFFDPGAVRPPREGADLVVPQRAIISGAMIAGIAAGVDGDFDAMVDRIGDWYDVCHALDAQAVVFRPRLDVNGDGTGLPVMAWRPGPARPFIVEVPHPFDEAHTRRQGVDAFIELEARAVIMNGADRCAGAEVMACDGSTSVCGGAYRDSDPAHNPDSVFQAMHVGLSERYHRHTVFSLHGISEGGAVISDGTEFLAWDDSPIALAAMALQAALEGHAEVLSCNGVRGLVAVDHHCGTTNVQGRHLNGSANTCYDRAETTNERFIHLELPRAVRDDARLRIDALRRIFDALDPIGVIDG